MHDRLSLTDSSKLVCLILGPFSGEPLAVIRGYESMLVSQCPEREKRLKIDQELFGKRIPSLLWGALIYGRRMRRDSRLEKHPIREPTQQSILIDNKPFCNPMGSLIHTMDFIVGGPWIITSPN